LACAAAERLRVRGRAPPLSFVPVFALGLAAGLLFVRTRALGPGIAAHLVHNGIAVLLAA